MRRAASVALRLVAIMLIGPSSASTTAAASAPLGAARLLSVSPEAFRDACRADIAAATQAADRFKATAAPAHARDAAAVLTALDEYDTAVALLVDGLSRTSLARNVHPDEAMRTTAAACESEFEKAMTELTLDRGVFERMQALPLEPVDAATRHYVTRTLRDFRRAGVDRDEATRARIKALRDELVTLGQQFDDNIAADVRSLELAPEELDGLPDDFKRAHPPGSNGKVVITTNNTDYQPVMAYSTSARAREALWKLYRQRAHPKNAAVLGRMLAARQELASALGFDTWADYAAGDKMVGTRHAIADFIDRIVRASEKRMVADYAALLRRRQRDEPGATDVAAWDGSYYQEKVKAEQYRFDSQTVRPYFEYTRVKQGVLDITAQMFGISYRAVTGAAVWHPDVEVYDIVEGTNVLGRIYLDMFPRDNKYKHYAQFPLINGKRGRTLPEGVLVCNFPKPGVEPALMQHSDVETLFHEFGHLLHHVLGGHTAWAGVSGVATEWDFVEAPSQMLEEWVWSPVTLQRFARHYQTGEPIPAETVARMKAADEFGKGLYVRQQMFYASLSLELHQRDPRRLDLREVVASTQERLTPYRFVDGTYFEESFTHLNGYSAAYYTYMWSLVIAKDMFTVFARTDLLNREAAMQYRRHVLEPGGSAPAAELVKNFLARPYEATAFESWLNAQVQ